jgi:hypothetical protein
MTHEEKLALARKRHGKKFKTDILVKRNTPHSNRLVELNQASETAKENVVELKPEKKIQTR